jgi:integrase
MGDSGVYDRWHRTGGGRRVRSAAYGQGKRWQARWRNEAGRQRKQNFDRRLDAERALATVKVDLLRGGYVDPRGGRVTVQTYGEQWRLAQVHRPTTAAHVETHLRRHLYPMFGDRALGSVRPGEVQAWVRGLEQRLAPSTIEVVYSFLAGIFKAAVRDRLLVTTPCVGIRLPKREPKRIVPLATERVEALIGAMPERYRSMVALAAGTGLRHGEALGLEVEAVDWLRRTLDVRQQLVTMPGQAPYIAPPKTPASHRTVPLPQVVVDALAAHLAAFGAARVEILDATVKPDPRRRTALLVFTDDAGRPLRRTRFSGIWRPAAAAAELDDGVTFHDLRHYYASLLITYSHLWPDSEDRTREAVDEVLGRVAGAEAAP